MTLVTFQDGAVVFRDGQVGTEQDCCCDQGCPEGCPDLTGCNLVIVLDYGDFQNEVVNFNAMDYAIDSYANCQLATNIADNPSESGGDIEVTITVVYDENCNPSPVVSLFYSDADIADFLVPVLVSFDCNPLP